MNLFAAANSLPNWHSLTYVQIKSDLEVMDRFGPTMEGARE